MLLIENCADPVNLRQQISTLQPQDLVIFLSANAVPAIQSIWSEYNPEPRVIAIGGGTAEALIHAGIAVNVIPNQHDSDGLLLLPQLQQVQSQRINIFCGENPRPLLKQTLTQYGARVSEVICYRRRLPKYAVTELTTALNRADRVVCTSLESLQNLIGQLPLTFISQLNQRLIVISPRMLRYAQRFSLQPALADGASDAAILQVLLNQY